MLLIRFLPTTFLFRFTKVNIIVVGWNGIARKKVDGANTIISPTQVEWCYVGKKTMFFQSQKKKKQRWHRRHLLHSNKKRQKKTIMTSLSSSSQQKIRKEKEKWAYFQTPTYATTLKLFLLGHSWSSQPLKLLWILRS